MVIWSRPSHLKRIKKEFSGDYRKLSGKLNTTCIEEGTQISGEKHSVKEGC